MSKYVGKIVTNQAPAGYSVYFDGTGDYLTVANNAAFQLGTGDFTIECWYYAQDISLVALVGLWGPSSSNASWLMYLDSSGNPQWYTSTNGSTQTPSLTSSRAITLNAWNHIAFSRSSGTTTIYVNGVSGGSTSTVINLFAATSQLTIGYNPIGGTPDYAVGYISNLRIVKGTALYPAAFTPPTQLLNVTNTSLLTCNSPAIVDQSSNAFAITTNGNAAVSTFTPFAAYNPYNPALGASTPGVWTLDEAMQAAATRQWNMYDPYFQNTTLLLHGNGTNGAQNNTFLDSSSNNFTITRNGNTTQGSFSPFSQTGWSGYFNSGAYISSSNWNNAGVFGTSDFTVECWVYAVDAFNSNQVIWSCNSYPNTTGLFLAYYGSTPTQLQISTGATALVTSSGGWSFNQWHHVAVTRSGTTLTLWINGVSRGSTTFANNCSDGLTFIGRPSDVDSYKMQGYISNLRITKSAALYTSSFSPPTTALTTTVASGTVSLLCLQSNRFVDNSSNAYTLTPNGSTTPSVQAFSPFYPTAAYTPQTIGGSGYFDGSGDYLDTGIQSNLYLNASDYTIEFWAYFTRAPGTANSGTGASMLVQGDGAWFGSPNEQNWAIFLDTTNIYFGKQPTVYSLAYTPPINAWIHFAFVGNSSGSITLYINGVSQGTQTSRTALGSASWSTRVGLGYFGDSKIANYFQGYMSGVRIVKGTQVYTGNFTPPTAPLTAITNTQLLLNYTNAGIVDSTAKNVLETVGNAQISTTQSKFGGSSMYFDGTGDWLLAPNSANLAFNTGDFTVECWVYPTASPSYACIIDTRNGFGTGGFGLFITSGTGLQIFTSSGVTIFTGTSCITTNTWQHVVVCRSGTNLRVFVNGTQIGSTVTNSANMSDGYLIIGNALAADRNYPLTGYIDDLRVTKGVARYTANFTPQTSQWQDQ